MNLSYMQSRLSFQKDSCESITTQDCFFRHKTQTCKNFRRKTTTLEKNRAPFTKYVIGESMEHTAMDFAGFITPRGNWYVMAICDHLTEWTQSFELLNQETKTVIKLPSTQWVAPWGCPHSLQTDQRKKIASDGTK